MIVSQLNRRIEELSEKLKVDPSEGIRLDFSSFTQPEQLVILKNHEFLEKYRNGQTKFSTQENALMLKFDEIVLKRTVELFLYNMSNLYLLDRFESYFFKLLFFDFLSKWPECKKNLRKWSKEEKEKILKHIKSDDEINWGFFDD